MLRQTVHKVLRQSFRFSHSKYDGRDFDKSKDQAKPYDQRQHSNDNASSTKQSDGQQHLKQNEAKLQQPKPITKSLAEEQKSNDSRSSSKKHANHKSSHSGSSSYQAHGRHTSSDPVSSSNQTHGKPKAQLGKVFIAVGIFCAILYLLPTQRQKEIHPMEWYKSHPDYNKRRGEQLKNQGYIDDATLYPEEKEKKEETHISL